MDIFPSMRRTVLILIAAFITSPALADDPQVIDVRVEKMGMVWSIHVTLEHPDTGWDHYADGWEVLDAEGNRLGYRELHHPHVNVQPFTRSLSGVFLPDGTREIHIRASCSVDSWSGETTRVELQP